MLVSLETKKILAVAHGTGRCHDYKLYKKSKTRLHPDIEALVDKGYQGMQNIHAKTKIPKKNSKKNPLTQAEKRANRALSKERVLVENVIGLVKRFKIIADKYRNRRKRFGLRFNLIAGFHNFEL